MKPTKNLFYCFDCGRTKMLFVSQKKADNFIKFNKDAFEAEGKKVPVRSYYCEACGGWHVTSNPDEEHFKGSSNHLLTKMERIVERKMQKVNYESFLFRKNKLISEAKDLYREQDYVGCLRKCREALQILKDNGKSWWDENTLIKKMMYEVVCCEAIDIDECIKREDFRQAEILLSRCGCVMNELEEEEGFEDYKRVLSLSLKRSERNLRTGRKMKSLKTNLMKLTERIDKNWGYLEDNKFNKVKYEIKKYTAELIILSNKYNENEIILPVVNKLFDLREAYRQKILLTA